MGGRAVGQPARAWIKWYPVARPAGWYEARPDAPATRLDLAGNSLQFALGFVGLVRKLYGFQIDGSGCKGLGLG